MFHEHIISRGFGERASFKMELLTLSVSTTLCPSLSVTAVLLLRVSSQVKSNTDGHNMRKNRTEPSKPGDLKEACVGGGPVWRSLCSLKSTVRNAYGELGMEITGCRTELNQ